MPALIALEDSLTRLSIAPALGAAITAWQRKSDAHHLLRPLKQPIEPHASARQAAAFAMMPWSNRISQGGIATPEGWFRLAANTADSDFAMHGSTWQQPWQVTKQGKSSLSLCCHNLWPVHLYVEQQIALDQGRLSIDFCLTHLDARPFLHGYGWHPFFYRNQATRLQMQVAKIWQRDTQGLSLYACDLPQALNFQQPRALPKTLLDHAFSAWQGEAIIQQPDLGYQLQLLCTDTQYVIVYCPPAQDFFCVEPVSHPINAHHLASQPGLIYLKYGQQIRWRVQLNYQSLKNSY